MAESSDRYGPGNISAALFVLHKMSREALLEHLALAGACSLSTSVCRTSALKHAAVVTVASTLPCGCKAFIRMPLPLPPPPPQLDLPAGSL
jgi:hypothetical protein